MHHSTVVSFSAVVAATMSCLYTCEANSGTIHQEYDGPWHWDELTRQTKSLDGKSAPVNGIWYPILLGTEYTGTAEITGSKRERAHLSIPSRISYRHWVKGPWGENNVETLLSYQTHDFEVVSITAGNVAPGFQLKSWLKDISIPSSVTNIGYGAFYGCANLTNVSLLARIDKIQEMTFCGTGLTSINIPDSVKTIEFAAFSGCSNLCEVVTPNSVEIIGNQAFVACPSLTRVVLTGVTNICQGAFWKCYGLRTVSLPQTLKNIDRYAFALTSLDSITIPDSVETIDDEAFFASGIKHIVVGKGVQSSGFIRSASGAGSLEFHSASVVNYITSSDITFQSATNVVVGSEIDEVPVGFYEHFPAFKQVGDSGNSGEVDDPNAPVVTVRDGLLVSVQGIGLTSLDIPKTVTQVADTAFADCSELREIIIPDSVEFIEANAFHNCTNLERLVVGSGVKYVGAPLFGEWDESGQTNILGSASLKELVVASPAFYNAMFRDGYNNWLGASYAAVTNVVFAGDGFKTIGNMGVFHALETVTIPDGASALEPYAFAGCVNLKGLVVPDSVEFVGAGAFMDCLSLERLAVGSGVTEAHAPLFGEWDESGQTNILGSASLKELVVASPAFYGAMFRDEYNNWLGASYPAVTNVVFDWRFVDLPEDYLARFPNAASATIKEALPDLTEHSDDAVVRVVNGAMDAGLSNVVDVATYNALRTWAIDNRQPYESENAAMAKVMSSHFAWSAFALDAPTLLTRATPIQKEDIKISSFEKNDTQGKFSMEVSIDDVVIGSSADSGRLAKILGIEGSNVLEDSKFASENVTLEAVAPINGKARIVVKPTESEQSNSFFMRVRVNQ